MVVASGEMDVSTAYRLEGHVIGEAGRGDRVALDLAGVTFIDSTGLRALLRLRQEAVRMGWRLRVAAVHPHVRRLLEMTGSHKLLGLEAD
jgi:anti-anti-sigma factor